MFARSWDLGGLCGKILAAPQGGMGRKQLRGGGGDGEGLRKGTEPQVSSERSC